MEFTEECIRFFLALDACQKIRLQGSAPGNLLQPPVEGAKLVGEEGDVAFPLPTGDVDGEDRLSWSDEIDQDAAQPLERVAGVGDDDEVDGIESAHLEEREGVLDDRADVGLEVSGSVAGVHSRRPPHLDGKDVKGPQEGAGIVNRKNGGYRCALLFMVADDF